jgi:hypothetical protein
VAALGAAGWRRRAGLSLPADLPAAVAPSLPALWQGDRLLAVAQPGAANPGRAQPAAIEARYRPSRPLAGAPFGAGTRPDPAPGCSGARPRRSLLRGGDHLC